MRRIYGTSIIDRIYNYAINLGFTSSAATAVAATISNESSAELIPFLGERQERYLNWAYSQGLNYIDPETKIKYIFLEMRKDPAINWGALKKSTNVSDAVKTFNRDYLNKELEGVELITLVSLANEINKLYVSNDNNS